MSYELNLQTLFQITEDWTMPLYSKIFVTDIWTPCEEEDINAEDLFNYTWYGTKLMYEVDGYASDVMGYYTDSDGNGHYYGN